MHKTHNPIRPFSFRAVSLLTLAVLLLSSSGLAQSPEPRRGTYKMASVAIGAARGNTISIHVFKPIWWVDPPPDYLGTVEITLVDAEGRELARGTRRIEGRGIATMHVNVDEILCCGGRIAVRAVVKLVESGSPDGAPPALAASLEVSDNATGKTTVVQSFADPSPTPWVLGLDPVQ